MGSRKSVALWNLKCINRNGFFSLTLLTKNLLITTYIQGCNMMHCLLEDRWPTELCRYTNVGAFYFTIH